MRICCEALCAAPVTSSSLRSSGRLLLLDKRWVRRRCSGLAGSLLVSLCVSRRALVPGDRVHEKLRSGQQGGDLRSTGL